ncbi:hypothetical protein EC957_000335 [Mortierella hygrophila]|uniref:Uncharacterized protein n=1 Tax=Mortierella hygrophila TaxID=979708 RepID=A0A9P6F7X0_9FUNG|nr:hypothetical protein EC957_000335 [Mortierella hygrophila]
MMGLPEVDVSKWMCGRAGTPVFCVPEVLAKKRNERVPFAELREYEFFARWRNANVNGKRP